MLAIRMQRTGRTGHAMFRVIVQDSRRTPTSGNVVAFLGNYDPHTKTVSLDKEKAALYLKNGAQPSDRTARLLKAEGIKLPKWVVIHQSKKGKVRNEAKYQKDQPKATVVAEAPVDQGETAEPTPEVTAETTTDESPEPVTETAKVAPEAGISDEYTEEIAEPLADEPEPSAEVPGVIEEPTNADSADEVPETDEATEAVPTPEDDKT